MVKHLPVTGADAGDGFSPWVRKVPWRRKWQPTPVLFPGESHGQGSLAGYSPGGRHESDMTEYGARAPGGTMAPAFAGGDNLPG